MTFGTEMTKSPVRWSAEEDQALLEMRQAGENWPAIAFHLSRTESGIYHRYRKLIGPVGAKKTAVIKWTPAEEKTLLTIAGENQAWPVIALKLKRSIVDVCRHYNKLIKSKR